MTESINVSIIGKPNVGKSTIFNKLLGSNLSEVSDKSGTTIYPISSVKEYSGLDINLIDLGGLKKNQNHISRIKRLSRLKHSKN